MAEHNEDSGFKVIDRRPFTAEGEVRKEVVEEQEREAKREEVKEKAAAKEAEKKAEAAPVDAPKKIQAFENLVRMLGSNAAMVLGAYPDPNTGQPMVDPDAARELIDILDALVVKTKGNLAPDEENMLTDLTGKLKLTYLEIQKAMAAEMAKMAEKVKNKK